VKAYLQNNGNSIALAFSGAKEEIEGETNALFNWGIVDQPIELSTDSWAICFVSPKKLERGLFARFCNAALREGGENHQKRAWEKVRAWFASCTPATDIVPHYSALASYSEGVIDGTL